jgi:hypothetical protein
LANTSKLIFHGRMQPTPEPTNSVPEFSIVVPVYNEAENIIPELRAIERDVRGEFEILIVYDFEEDTTLPSIRGMDPPIARVRLVRNDLGKGVVNAIRKGFIASRGRLGAVVTMADLSDPPERINAMVGKLRDGCDVVAGSRYMKGGSQIGGPFIKRTLSRLAGESSYWLSGVGIHDVTTNFRAYSRRVVKQIPNSAWNSPSKRTSMVGSSAKFPPNGATVPPGKAGFDSGSGCPVTFDGICNCCSATHSGWESECDGSGANDRARKTIVSSTHSTAPATAGR